MANIVVAWGDKYPRENRCITVSRVPVCGELIAVWDKGMAKDGSPCAAGKVASVAWSYSLEDFGDVEVALVSIEPIAYDANLFLRAYSEGQPKG